MKILCDHMLGSLATWLRILGVDTVYPDNQMSDEELLKIAAQDQRLIISRDKQLIAQGKKRLIPVLELHTTDLDEQLEITIKALDLNADKMLSRCTLCNTPLEPRTKDDAEGNVPPKVFQSHQEFWYCPHCHKYYWMGTHYQNMKEKITTLTTKEKP